MVKVELNDKTENMVLSLSGDELKISAELSLVLAFFRRLLVENHGEEEAKKRYKDIVKDYKTPESIELIDSLMKKTRGDISDK